MVTYKNSYISLNDEESLWLDNYIKQTLKESKTNLSKNEILRELVRLGMDVKDGKYLELEKDIDDFVSQLREITIEKNNTKFTYKKSKKQVYYMLIEKGLENLSDGE